MVMSKPVRVLCMEDDPGLARFATGSVFVEASAEAER